MKFIYNNLRRNILLITFVAFLPAISSYAQDLKSVSIEPIVFQSGFEEGNKNIWDDYDGNQDSENQIISDLGPLDILGNHVLRLAVSESSGGSDVIKVLASSYDKLYVRWYQKFENGYDFNVGCHAGGLAAGGRNNIGKDAHRPEDYVWTSLEYDASQHTPYFYVYYPGMYQDCADPNGACWGDHLPCTSDEGTTYCEKEQHRDPPMPPTLTTDVWYCYESKLDLGTASSDGSVADGSLSLTIDGVEYGNWNDLWMRKSDAIKIDIVWISLYYGSGIHSAGVLFDNVVVSTEPIGMDPVGTEQTGTKDGKLSKLKRMNMKVSTNHELKTVDVSCSNKSNFTILLFDLSGKLLVNKKISGTKGSINTENINQGMYILKIIDANTSILSRPSKLFL